MPSGILYPYIPAMPECDRCGRCCGPVAVTDREAALILAYMAEHRVRWRAVEFAGLTLTCGFYNRLARSCSIYPVRPFACRLFGVAVEMVCPFYPDAAVLSFPADRAAKEGWSAPHDALLADVVGPIPILVGDGC